MLKEQLIPIRGRAAKLAPAALAVVGRLRRLTHPGRAAPSRDDDREQRRCRRRLSYPVERNSRGRHLDLAPVPINDDKSFGRPDERPGGGLLLAVALDDLIKCLVEDVTIDPAVRLEQRQLLVSPNEWRCLVGLVDLMKELHCGRKTWRAGLISLHGANVAGRSF